MPAQPTATARCHGARGDSLPAAGPAARRPVELPEYGWDEIRQHDTADDFWIVFADGVYDVSEWMYRHPGGAEILIEAWGQDATEFFNSIGHSAEAWLLTEAFQVGRLAAGAQPPAERGTPTMSVPAGPSAYGPGPRQAGPKLNPLPEPADPPGELRDLPEYDWDEVLRHNKTGDYWTVLWGGVYDLSEWLYHHPGGAEVLIDSYGHDASEAFSAIAHSDAAWSLARTFKIGQLKAGALPPARVGRPTMTAGYPVPAADRSTATGNAAGRTGPAADGPVDIPYAVRWLVPDGERFANFHVINDNDTQLDYQRRYGHIYAVGIPTKKWRLVMVSDPQLLDEVASNEEQFAKRVEDINFFDQLAGSRGAGISVVSDGDYYDWVRRVMLPWYAPAHQRTQFDRMKELAKKMVAAWALMPDDQPLDLREWMARYALEVSGRGACNYDFGLLDADAVKRPFAAAVPDSTRESIARIGEPRPDFTLLSGRAKRARKRTYRRHNDVLFTTAGALVDGRVNTCPAGVQTDLLSRLITVPDPVSGERLNSATIRDQILMHLSNGFNGPSFTGAWLGYVLSCYPAVEEKLLDEIDSITRGDPSYELQYADLMALPYMTQVIKETLRVYPPLPVTIRRSCKDGLLGRYRVRKNDMILVGALAAHHDPRYWGPTPAVFDPERFTMDKVIERPRHAFIPFSVGIRQCMAQEVTFMMLRVALFEVYNRYRLRVAPGATVVKNTAVSTKPVTVPVVRLPREGRQAREGALARRRRETTGTATGARAAAGSRDWDRPSDIPASSAYQHLVIAYGSNFGSCKGLAERFADRSSRFGFTHEVLALNDLADAAPRDQPWLLIVVTATYTANPPTNAIAFKSWLDHAEPGCPSWKNCHYLIWGLGNSQWNAFLAFPRYVQARLAELGATALSKLAFGDVGSPTWEDVHAAWNDRVWPMLIELSGATPSDAAAARVVDEMAAEPGSTV